MTPVCARPGCSRRIPPFAARHGDPFCSSTCLRLELGLISRAEANTIERGRRSVTGSDDLKSQDPSDPGRERTYQAGHWGRACDGLR